MDVNCLNNYDWPEDYQTHGEYEHECKVCSVVFYGGKGRLTCKVCLKPLPEQQPNGQVYGIIDPDYGRLYTIIRTTAWQEGYAIGMHGSFTRDLDLIAVPWAEKYCAPEHLIRRILSRTRLKERPDNPGIKPHGRKTWTLLLPEFGDPRWIDLSIVTHPNPVWDKDKIPEIWESLGGMDKFGKSFGYMQFAEEIMKAHK